MYKNTFKTIVFGSKFVQIVKLFNQSKESLKLNDLNDRN